MTNNKTQEERLDYLVEGFKADSDEYKDLETPNSTEEKRRILHSLMNIRMPKEMSPKILKVQDEYLTERAAEKGVVNLSDIPVIRDGLSIWQGDITRLLVDAIVNAANSQMLGCFAPMHTCIDNTAHMVIVAIRYMILAIERFNNTDNRSIEELFYAVQREIVNEMMDCAIILVLDTLLKSVKQYFDTSDEQMNELVCLFIDNLPMVWKERFRRPTTA